MELAPFVLSPAVFCPAVACIIGAWIAWGVISHRRAHAARRARFASRPRMEGDEWFSQFLPEIGQERESLHIVLEALGSEIGVDWTQLRPDDGFSDALRLPRSTWRSDDLEEFDDKLAAWAKQHGLGSMTLDLPDDRLDTLVRALAERLRRSEEYGPGCVRYAPRT